MKDNQAIEATTEATTPLASYDATLTPTNLNAHQECRRLNNAGPLRYSVSSNCKVFGWQGDVAFVVDRNGNAVRPWTGEDQKLPETGNCFLA